jgi:hypothetical protein
MHRGGNSRIWGTAGLARRMVMLGGQTEPNGEEHTAVSGSGSPRLDSRADIADAT